MPVGTITKSGCSVVKAAASCAAERAEEQLVRSLAAAGAALLPLAGWLVSRARRRGGPTQNATLTANARSPPPGTTGEQATS